VITDSLNNHILTTADKINYNNANVVHIIESDDTDKYLNYLSQVSTKQTENII
jgi:hypothetical protein